MSGTSRIGVIGTGAWGTALAQALRADHACDILLYARRPEIATSINERHENSDFLPGVTLHADIRATTELRDLSSCAVLLLVTPAQHVRATLRQLAALGLTSVPIVICAKGIEIESGLLMSEVARQEVADAPLAVLTGPTFAADIVRGLPSAVTLAASDHALAEAIRDHVGTRTLRPYVSDDVIGAQVGGAVKNVIAIGCGMIAGRGLGESARAALLTRGLAEMARLAVALGGRRETLMGLSGLGDLVLTASSPQSRNFSLGLRLGQGESLAAILGGRTAVTEGVHTARALAGLAARLQIEMPVAGVVDRCLNENFAIEDAFAHLLNRPWRAEAL